MKTIKQKISAIFRIMACKRFILFTEDDKHIVTHYHHATWKNLDELAQECEEVKWELV